jgi:hypothetical protein
MRKERRIGGPVRVSTGDRGVVVVLIARVTAAGDGELDERGVVGVGIGGGASVGEVVTAGAADAALDEQFEVDAATLVVIETVVERVPEGVEAEVFRAAGIGTIEEGAVVVVVGHCYVSLPDGGSSGTREVSVSGLVGRE